ncbi:MAG: rhodanese-like domain-containing protein [Proteobacteria bacterium]|nr:rhodanese-like domain-containing protein [Pseudomonadota bacterium]MBU4294591.1 rhodanese-like domain-containing protein [Pseudomonadota bacterium]MCG2747127.1 rhodanese-like domain-containing protein [Desulfobulbaceae bacterium]
MGYSSVFCFKGGIPEWRAFNYPLTVKADYTAIKINKLSPRQVYALLRSDPTIYVLDVRPIDCSRKNIFIRGAKICPMVYLDEWYHHIPKDAKIVVTDWTNKKAILAAKFLSSRGYQVLGVLKGGIVRWRDEKLPVERVDNAITHDPSLCAD